MPLRLNVVPGDHREKACSSYVAKEIEARGDLIGITINGVCLSSTQIAVRFLFNFTYSSLSTYL